MINTTNAIYKGGVFHPDVPPLLPENKRVRLLIFTEADEFERREQAWRDLLKIWESSIFRSDDEYIRHG